MAELTFTKLNPDNHLLLEQPLLRLPHELSRQNFKSVQKHFERDQDAVLSSLRAAANASMTGQDPAVTVSSLDSMLIKLQVLKRKMETVHEEQKVLNEQSRKRIQHLKGLYDIPSLTDVKYDEWSRIRLNRLLVDYLLRSGFGESAKALAQDKGIEDLVDLDVFVRCHKIEESLRGGDTKEALTWCIDHKPMMRKTNNNLEFQLRFQQYVELVREGNHLQAIQHCQRFLALHIDTHEKEIGHAAGLLAYPENTQLHPYKELYSQDRWTELATLFVKTHHEIFSLPDRPLLHIALSAGLSALKTPSCHSAYASSTSNASSSTTVCPICSTELNELARDLPYAHHTKSHVENDPVALPNGRVYGRERLMQMSAKVGLENGQVKDPTTLEVYDASQIRKVYIS